MDQHCIGLGRSIHVLESGMAIWRKIIYIPLQRPLLPSWEPLSLQMIANPLRTPNQLPMKAGQILRRRWQCRQFGPLHRNRVSICATRTSALGLLRGGEDIPAPPAVEIVAIVPQNMNNNGRLLKYRINKVLRAIGPLKSFYFMWSSSRPDDFNLS